MVLSVRSYPHPIQKRQLSYDVFLRVKSGKIVLCCIVCHNCEQWNAHTHTHTHMISLCLTFIFVHFASFYKLAVPARRRVTRRLRRDTLLCRDTWTRALPRAALPRHAAASRGRRAQLCCDTRRRLCFAATHGGRHKNACTYLPRLI